MTQPTEPPGQSSSNLKIYSFKLKNIFSCGYLVNIFEFGGKDVRTIYIEVRAAVLRLLQLSMGKMWQEKIWGRGDESPGLGNIRSKGRKEKGNLVKS